MGTLKEDMVTVAKSGAQTTVSMLVGAGIGLGISELVVVTIHGVKWIVGKVSRK